MMNKVVLSALLFLSTTTTTQAAWEIPADKDVMTHFGQCQQEQLSRTFRLFVWNIKKAEAKDRWRMDFDFFIPKSDVVLIQEAMVDSYMPNVVIGHQNYCWDFATSFLMSATERTGVLSGANITTASVQFARSPGRESVVPTPKMTLITEYKIAGSDQTLMVANIHGLNFTSNSKNSEQVAAVLKLMSKHKGPMIFAGDFNTWNKQRMDDINAQMAKMGMKSLLFPEDQRTFKLDHIYARGMDAFDYQIHDKVKSSDHFPLTATFVVQ